MTDSAAHLRALISHPAIADEAVVKRVTEAIRDRDQEYGNGQGRVAIAALLEPITGSLLVSGVIQGAIGEIDALQAENKRLRECISQAVPIVDWAKPEATEWLILHWRT